MSSVKVSDIIQLIEDAFPLNLQENWDNSGLQIGDSNTDCTGVLLSLDITEHVISEAIKKNCNLIISHHPLLFRALKKISDQTYIERCVKNAITNNITIYSAHTNVDVSPKGLNVFLASAFGLKDVELLEDSTNNQHSGLGAIGVLPEPIEWSNLEKKLAVFFQSNQIHFNSPPNKLIRRIAICGGAGAFLWQKAKDKGADIFITGEAKYNDYLDAEGIITLITVGHYESEYKIANLFYQIISSVYPQIANITELENNPVNSIIL